MVGFPKSGHIYNKTNWTMIMNNMQGLSNDEYDMNPSSAQTQVIALLEYLTFHVV